MKYKPENVVVIIGNEDGSQKVVTGVDPNSFFKKDKYTPETEMSIARDIVEDFNKAILNFPFKVPLSRTTVTFAEDVIRDAYKITLSTYATVPRVMYNQNTKRFDFVMISFKEELKEIQID